MTLLDKISGLTALQKQALVNQLTAILDLPLEKLRYFSRTWDLPNGNRWILRTEIREEEKTLVISIRHKKMD